MNPLLILAVFFSILTLIKFCITRSVRNLLLLGFWVIFAIELYTRITVLLIPAFLCIAGFWYLKKTEKKRALGKIRKMMKEMGYSDEKIEEQERMWSEAAKINQRKAEEEQRLKEQKAERERAFKVSPNPVRTSIPIELRSAASFQTDEESYLECSPGSFESQIYIKGIHELEEGVHLIVVDTFLTDEDGIEWTTTSYVDPTIFLDDFTQQSDLHYLGWDDLSDSEKAPVKENCQITNVSTLLDSRSYGRITVNEVSYSYFEKYQGPQLDLGWDKNKTEWVCRVSQLYRDPRDDEPDQSPDENDGTIPAFIIRKKAEVISIFIHPQFHASTPEDSWEEPEDRRSPVVYRRTGKRATKQEGIKCVQSGVDKND